MSKIWYLNEIVELIRERARKENRAAGDILQEVINSLKEELHCK
ncbi:hypothetical protein CLL_A0926 [Clostridium botulinum B str. Eklund 17B (NRP)]|uniref:Uncharacterized protein n=1 Tax=Clostridium botulinum (strain Eklund 17B / Type B) TaxID=935198 RepID=B2TMD9_CLOBB|nr:hypothetical protein CLL_A0926 [Clostridium botulinum B str. Eklund 17B (NRP)]CDH89851.1 hypothetical protein CB17B0862 [Clostridium botulinum B str. Eklund 17B (NRP)]